MQPLEKINAYVTLVCNQIRWKKAHHRVTEEMKNHILDQRDSYIKQGLDEETATEKAITETGDAVAIGLQFDKTHRPKPQWGLLAITALLLIIGFSIQQLIFADDSQGLPFNRRWPFTVIGIGVMFIACFTDFSIFGKYPKTIYFSVILFSMAALILSPQINGKSFYTQYLILLYPLSFASIVFASRNKGYRGMIQCGAAFVLQALLALNVPSVSGLFLFTVAAIILISAANHKNWFGIKRLNGYLLIYTPIILIGALILMNKNIWWNRVAVALNPSISPNDAGFLGSMTRELLRGANLYGLGYIPEQYQFLLDSNGLFIGDSNGLFLGNIFQTDLLLTALTVYGGWLALALALGVLLFFIGIIISLCLRQKSCLGLLISLSIVITFSMQAAVYILFNLGFQLISPISLPLISYANTATVINLGLIGFMLSVFRTGDIVEDGRQSPIHKNNQFLSWNDGSLTIHFNSWKRKG